jgi:hypothetical protein
LTGAGITAGTATNRIIQKRVALDHQRTRIENAAAFTRTTIKIPDAPGVAASCCSNTGILPKGASIHLHHSGIEYGPTGS